jgi:pilus assembly protein CpaB
LRASTIVMIGLAVVFGLLAVFIAQAWLNNQASMQAKNFEANKK